MTTTTVPTAADATPVHRLYAAHAAGDLAAARAVLAPDVVLHVPGRNPNAGTFTSPDGVVAWMAAASERAGGTETVEPIDLAVGAEHVVAIVLVRGDRPGRPLLENRVCHVYRIRDGLVAEAWFHNFDQHATDAFWS